MVENCCSGTGGSPRIHFREIFSQSINISESHLQGLQILLAVSEFRIFSLILFCRVSILWMKINYSSLKVLSFFLDHLFLLFYLWLFTALPANCISCLLSFFLLHFALHVIVRFVFWNTVHWLRAWASLPRFWYVLFHLLALWPWASSLYFLGLSCLSLSISINKLSS